MHVVVALLAASLLCSSIAVTAVAGTDDGGSAKAQFGRRQQPLPPQRRRPLPRPPPPPHLRRPTPPPLRRHPPPPMGRIIVQVSGYKDDQAFNATKVLSSLRPRQRRQLYSQQKGTTNYRRYKAWESNLNKTIAWNRREDVSYARAAYNAFSDFTPEELARMLLMRGIKPQPRTSSVEGLPDEDFVDWSKQGKLPPVRNQAAPGKDCGSSFAFAALTAISSKALIEGLPSRDLSAQQILDCVNNASNPSFQSSSCSGGYPGEAFEYIAQNGFIAREVEYPYTATDNGTCIAGSVSRSGAFALSPTPGYEWVPGNNFEFMKAVARAPLVVYFNVEEESNFYYYDSGIYEGNRNCSSGAVNHAMLLVGYHLTKRAWIMRNSWGDDWGEQGNVRVAMIDDPAGTCGMNLFGGLLPLDVSLWQPPPPSPPPPPPQPSAMSS